MNKLTMALAAVLSGMAIALATTGRDSSRVDIGSASLRMLMAGSAGPTVVFESGAGSPLETWLAIQPEVSTFSRTIAYDRAGNGLSDKGTAPRDGRQVATDLHLALRNAQAPPPYVLVGHSLGGPYIRVFAGMYPDEVAGMVLVDPTQEELILWDKARKPKTTPRHRFRPDDEVDCAPMTFEQARQSQMPPGIPVVLITGMGPRVIPGFLPEELKEEVRQDQLVLYPAKLKFHQSWVEQFPGGRLIITRNSGHGIPFEEPELVIRTIREVVDRVRSLSSSTTTEAVAR